MARQKYYYQQINDIGKEIAVVASYTEITDTKHYREVSKEYYDAVIEFLREIANNDTDEMSE